MRSDPSRACGITSAEADGDFRDIAAEGELAYMEDLLGVAFVAVQAELTAVRMTIHRLNPASGKSIALFQRGTKTVPGTSFTYIEALNHIANYWKHQTEWPVKRMSENGLETLDWDEEKETRTIKEVRALGMARGAQDNIHAALKRLGVVNAADLSQLRAWVSDWTEALLAEAATL